MLCRFAALFILVCALASETLAFEVQAILREINLEQRVATVFANGQERHVKIADDVKTLDENGKELGRGLNASKFSKGSAVTLRVERVGNTMTIVVIRAGGEAKRPNGSDTPAQMSVGQSSVGFKPLTEMTADDRYKGEEGGLYGNGRNEPPDSLRTIASQVTALIKPLDTDGRESAGSRIGVVSISMSNATQEFSRFKQLADADADKSERVTIVDCAQGGQTMARWADSNAECWKEADRRLKSAGVSLEQVHVAWIKLANAGPHGELAEHGKQLERDTRIVLANLIKHFPNLRVAYLGSRIYGGWADGRLNPEPYAYEGAFVVRWLIQSQMRGDADLNWDPERGEVRSPLLLWGPYFWADGTTPRKTDGLTWERSDLVGDGTHPSTTGRQKVAEQLLTFFKTDDFTRVWFLKH